MESYYQLKIKPASIKLMTLLTTVLLAACQPAATQNVAQTIQELPPDSPTATSIPLASTLTPLPTTEVSETEPAESVGEVPYYARHAFAEGMYLHNDEWAVIYFYRPPDCVPDPFNLLKFYSSQEVYDCGPVTTSGTVVWENETAQDGVPIEAHLTGFGAVPVWFVPWPALEIVVADDVLKMFELKQLPLLKGTATAFEETQVQEPCCRLEVTASGVLENGEPFAFVSRSNQSAGASAVSETEITLPDGSSLSPEPEAFWGNWSNTQLVLEIFEDSSMSVYLYGSVLQDGRQGHKFYQGTITYEDGIMTFGGGTNELPENPNDPCASASKEAHHYFVQKMPGENIRLRFVELKDDCDASKKDFSKIFEPFTFP